MSSCEATVHGGCWPTSPDNNAEREEATNLIIHHDSEPGMIKKPSPNNALCFKYTISTQILLMGSPERRKKRRNETGANILAKLNLLRVDREGQTQAALCLQLFSYAVTYEKCNGWQVNMIITSIGRIMRMWIPVCRHIYKDTTHTYLHIHIGQ